jgi:hypothetical protein
VGIGGVFERNTGDQGNGVPPVTSIYHALTLKVERRLARSVGFNVSYTLSHSNDDASSPGATESEANIPQNVRNIFDETGEWALSSRPPSSIHCGTFLT